MMKKFLVLSFLMVMLAATAGFAQTRTVSHYTSNPAPAQPIVYTIQEPLPSMGRDHYYAWLTAGQYSPGDIDYVQISTYIQFIDNSFADYSRVTYGHDGAWVDFGCDITQVQYIWYAFEIIYTNGTFEIYDVVDTYQ